MPPPGGAGIPSFKENAVNLSAMSRDALVEALVLATGFPACERCVPVGPLGAREAGAASEGTQEVRLQHVLAIAKELLLRNLHRDLRGQAIDSPAALRDWLRLYCASLEHEVFVAIFLDARHRVIDAEVMFRGTLTQTSVYPREVVKAALARNAAAVVFAHNHPSGSSEPSRADERLTMTLKQSLALVDVCALDHFIVAGDQLLSMAERGLM
jgi:DNA repair protein RadC